MKMNLGSLELEVGLALGLTPRRLLVLLQGQVGIRWSTRVGISRTLQKRTRVKCEKCFFIFYYYNYFLTFTHKFIVFFIALHFILVFFYLLLCSVLSSVMTNLERFFA